MQQINLKEQNIRKFLMNRKELGIVEELTQIK